MAVKRGNVYAWKLLYWWCKSTGSDIAKQLCLYSTLYAIVVVLYHQYSNLTLVFGFYQL